MPDDPEIIAKIKTTYDPTGAEKAKRDMRQLSRSAEKLPKSRAKEGDSFARVASQAEALSALSNKAEASLANLKLPDVPVQTATNWKTLLTNLTKGADSGTLSLSGLSGAALRFGALSAGFAAVQVSLQGVSKAVAQVGQHFQTLSGVAADTSGVMTNLFAAASDTLAQSLSGATIRFLEMQKAAGGVGGELAGGAANYIAGLTQYSALQASIQQNQAAAEQAGELARAKERAHWKAAREAVLANKADNYGSQIAAGMEAAKDEMETSKSIAQEIAEKAERTAEAQTRASEAELQTQQTRISLEQARGDISAQQAATALATARQEHAERLAQITRQAQEAKVKLSQAFQEAADSYEQALGSVLDDPQLAKFAPVLEVKLPDIERLKEIAVLLENRNSALSADEEKKLRAERDSITAQAQNIAGLFAKLDSAMQPSPEEAVKLAQSLQNSANLLASAQEAAGQAADDAKLLAQTSRQEAELKNKKTQNDAEEAEAALELAEAQAAAAKRAKGWERAQEGDLNEQERYVEKMLTAVKQSSDEWEKWAAASRKLANERAMQDLAQISEMSQSLGGSADLLAQQKILATQRERLAELTRRTGLSAATMSAINKELAGVQRNSAAWRASMAKRAKEGQDNLLHAKAPDLPAKNKTMAGNLKQLNKAYEKDLRDLELAARKGDQEDIKHLIAHLRQNTRAREAITGNTGKLAEDLLERLKDAQALAKVGDGLTPEKRRKQHVEELLNGPLDPKKDPPRALPKEKPEQPRREKKPQQKPRREHPPAAPAAPPIDIAPATQAAKQAAANTAQAAKQMSELAASISSIGSAAQELASATQNAISSTQTAIKAIERKINSILLKL